MTEPCNPYVVPLGVSAALPILDQANSFLAVARAGRYWLVDCAESPIQRLQKAGLDPLKVQGVIITHFHPDHVYGLPAFIMGLFLLGMERDMPRQRALRIFARPEVLTRVETLVNLFEPQRWKQMYPIEYHSIKAETHALVSQDEDFEITAAPACHSVPSLALRFALPGQRRTFVYSSDTEPCQNVADLAQDATLLFHEATNTQHGGHATPSDAGTLAAQVGVEHLVLIHYRHLSTAEKLQSMAEARATFGRPVSLAQEFQIYPW